MNNNELPIIDEAEVLARVDGDRELLGEMAELFLTDCQGLLAKVREAVEHQDRALLQRAAHTLKGSVGNFAAKAAYEAARKMELMGRNGELAGAEQAYASLEQELARLTPVLTTLSQHKGG
ncbi:MAG: Hpt domain-containing protein [Planctomycetota bacterium]